MRILDHHKDDGHSPAVTGDARRIAYGEAAGLAKGAALGSCCTLVAQLLLDEAPALLRAEPLLGKLLSVLCALRRELLVELSQQCSSRSMDARPPRAHSSSGKLKFKMR